MGKMRKLGNAALAAVLAFALSLPTPALAFATTGGALAPAGVGAAIAPLDANADVWDGSVDVSWYVGHEADREFTLTTPAQLAGLAALVNGTADVADNAPKTFTGVTFKLGCDLWMNAEAAHGIDASGVQRSWTPIGDLYLKAVEDSVDGGSMPRYDDSKYFDGTFDGQGHAIKNLYVYNDVEGTYGGVQALFANVGGNALIKDTGIDGGFVYGRVAAGLVAISHVTDASKVPHIIGCYNAADIKGNGSTTRGLAGIFAGEEQYRSQGTATVKDPDTGEEDVVVTQEANYHGGAYIANCYNTGELTQVFTSSNSTGGIAGTGSVKIFGCYNSGRIERDSRYAAAIAGVLVSSDINVGQNSSSETAFRGASEVADSYALEGGVVADDQDLVKLYNLIDANHGKGQTGQRNPGVTAENAPASVGFKPAEWFAGADSWKALSQSFVAGATSPRLYWQAAGEGQWDLNREENGRKCYDVVKIGGQEASKAAFPYTGSPLTPLVEMSYEARLANGERETVALHQGSDFTVAYSNNVEISEGAATITVTGLGRFFNGRDVHFKITGGSLDDVSISAVPAQWWYGAGTVNPPVKVVAPNGDVLKKDVDYMLEVTGVPVDSSGFSGGEATATATVKAVEGSAAFVGSATATFTVLQASEKLSGTGTQDDPWVLSSKADLQFLAHQTSAKEGSEVYGADGKHFKVTADIDASSSDETFLEDRPADPLFSYYSFGEGDARFGGLGGTIDGDGHVITLGQTTEAFGLDGTDFENLTALVVYTKHGAHPTFKNLVVAGSSFAPGGAAAGFLIMGQPGTITFDCCVNKARVEGNQSYFGASAGFVVETANDEATKLVMTGCANEGEIVSTTRSAGFVANLGGAEATFSDCGNSGSVTVGSNGGAGGFVAFVQGAPSADQAFGFASFEGCSNSGDVSVKGGDAGGLVGWNQEAVLGMSFERCSNTGTVTYRGLNNAGAGLVGRAYSPAQFVNCYSSGTVKNDGSLIEPAGILGYANALPRSSEEYASYREGKGDAGEGFSFRMANVYSADDFGESAPKAGGLVGSLFLHQRLELDNCYFRSGEGAARASVANDYAVKWPDAIDVPITSGEGVQVDEPAMRDAYFASMLGAAFKADEPDLESGEFANGGFPTLLPVGAHAEIKDLCDEGRCSLSHASSVDYTGIAVSLGDLEVTYDGKSLREGVDYVAFYSLDGTKGTVIVQGVGGYSGMRESSFDVVPCSLSKCRLSQVRSLNFTDTIGAGGTQDVTLTNPAGVKMAEGADYEVLYANNMAPGRAYLLVRAKSPLYSGTLLRAFTIEPGDLESLQVQELQDHYAWSGASGGLYIYEQLKAANGQELSRADYYCENAADKGDYVRVFYSYDEATGEYDLPVYVNGDAGNGWAKRVTDAGRYMVELRGDGWDTVRKDNWTNGHWTGETRAYFTYGNRMESDEDVEVSGADATYGQETEPITGKVVPRLVNKNTGYDLVKGEDYTLSFEKLDETAGAYIACDEVDEAGEYHAVITGKGAWFGTRRVSFEVVSANWFIGDKATVTGIAAQYLWTGKAVKPTPKSVTITAEGLISKLEAGLDYTVSYVSEDGEPVAEPTDVGVYYVVIAGDGVNYKGAKRVKFAIEKPFVKVYVKKGANGIPQLAKQYTKAQFAKLKSAKAAANPVSALYCDKSGSNWKVASTNDYVMLGDLFKNAGVTWAKGASMTYSSGGFSGKSYTFDQLNSLMFYPSTSATATDKWGGKKAPFVLALSSFSSIIGENDTTFAAEAEEFNLGNLDSAGAPRAIMGVMAKDYADPVKNGANMAGSRLVKGVDSITVTLPASTMAASAKTITATYGKAATFDASKAFTVKNAKGAVTYKKKADKTKITVAKNGKVTVPKNQPVGTFKVTVVVTDAGKGAYQPVSKNVTLTVKVAKAKKAAAKQKKK